MNMQLGRQALSKAELERMVFSWLRLLPSCQHLNSVEIAQRPSSTRNWTLISTDPALSTAAENLARNALLELQREFRLQA
jgi:hypothetical protein